MERAGKDETKMKYSSSGTAPCLQTVHIAMKAFVCFGLNVKQYNEWIGNHEKQDSSTLNCVSERDSLVGHKITELKGRKKIPCHLK